MVVTTAFIYVISGLSHVGDEHTSPLPDSATYNKPAAPRSSKFPSFKLAGLTDCFIHGDGLNVAKALGHLKAYAARCPLGGGPSGAIRLTGPAGLRALRPEQQPGEPHSPLGVGTSERDFGEVPPGVAPTTAQENFGWRPGVAHREMSVKYLARKGVDPKTTKEDVRRGLQSLKLDSHHLRGSRCSSWAPRTLGLGYLKFHQNSFVKISTLGIELRLTPEVIATLLGNHQPNKGLSVIAIGSFGSCPGDGGNVAVAEDITLVFGGRRILGLRTLCDTLLRGPFPGSACCGPAGGNYGQFYFLDFLYKVFNALF